MCSGLKNPHMGVQVPSVIARIARSSKPIHCIENSREVFAKFFMNQRHGAYITHNAKGCICACARRPLVLGQLLLQALGDG
jgi:hypothetical protein